MNYRTMWVSAVLCLCLQPFMVNAEDDDTALSQYEVVEDGEKLMSLSALEDLENEARELLKVENCTDALPLIISFSENANITANVIARGVQPYYKARRDDQKKIAGRAGFNELVRAESAANKLKQRRNEFWFLEAKCHHMLGDEDKAVPRLFRALNFIDGKKQADLWKEARQLLWSTVGYNR